MYCKAIALSLILALCMALISCAVTVNPPSTQSPSAGQNSSGGNDNQGIYIPIITPTYTVTFQTNGGTAVSSKKLSVLNTAPQTSKQDHVFCGWYQDASFQVPAVYPLEIKGNTTLYAKWMRTAATIPCMDTAIKFLDNGYKSASYYQLNPPGFDLQALAAEGYIMKIHVTYDVYYRKDYDVLWDVGYAGAPKYEVYILNSDNIGSCDENITATKSARTRSISYKASVSSLLNTSLYLKFSTDNVQNIIYFENIKVEIVCQKQG